MTEKLYITIDGQAQAVTLVDNQATKTLVEKLQQAPVTLSLSNTTGISNVRSNSERGVFYTLNGQRVENPNKGIFIRNGKKVIL